MNVIEPAAGRPEPGVRRVKLLLYESKRIASDYGRAVRSELAAARSSQSASRRLRKLLRAKRRYGIGPLYYALYRLADVPESEWPNYITDDPAFKARLAGMIPAADFRIAQNKALTYQHCLAHGLSTIPVLCVVGHSPDPLGPAVPLANSLDEWRRAMANAGTPLFVKKVDGTYGDGAFVVERGTNGFLLAGQAVSLDALYWRLWESKGESGWVVQPRVNAHRDVARITSAKGLPTVRVLTATVDGHPRLLFAALKITVRDNVTDNFEKGKSGNLLAPIDPESGVVGCPWGSCTSGWPVMAPFPVHPDSGQPIEGAALPLWRELVVLAERAQASLPGFRSVGWDIAIAEHGPVIVEANATYDMSVLQIAHQRGLRRELDAALSSSVNVPTTEVESQCMSS